MTMLDGQKAAPKMPTPTIQSVAKSQPAPQAPPRPQAPQRSAANPNHPAVAEYVAEWNRMAAENDKLRLDNLQLKYDLDCARHLIGELQHISDHERAKKEVHQRWAARFDTLAGEIAGLSNQLRDEARQAALPEPELAQIEAQPEALPAEPPPVEDFATQFATKLAQKYKPKADGEYK